MPWPGRGRGHEDRGDRARCKRPAARKAGTLSDRSSRTMGSPRLRTVGAPAIDAPHRRSRRDDHAAGLGSRWFVCWGGGGGGGGGGPTGRPPGPPPGGGAGGSYGGARGGGRVWG